MNQELVQRQREYWDSRARGEATGLKRKILARFFRTGFVGVNRLREVHFVSTRLLGDRILDVGCGDGALLAKVRRRAGGRRYSGIDFSPPMVEIACARGFECRVMNMCELAFEDRAFDTTFAVRSVKNVVERPGQEQALLEICRITERRFILFDTFMRPGRPANMPHYNLDLELEQVKRVMQAGGFRPAEQHFFPSKLFYLRSVVEQVSPEGCLVFDRDR